MGQDSRVSAVDGFTETQHQSVPPSLDPADVTLPDLFTVCIIGASTGIGEHIAYAYAKARVTRIVLASRSVQDLRPVAERIRKINGEVQVDTAACDVTNPSSVASLANMVRENCEWLDCLVFNAGYAGPVTLKMNEGKPEWVQQAFNVNAMGTYLAAHYFVPLLLSSPNGTKGFLAVGSVAGCLRRGPIANTGYTISKMAQIRLVEYLNEQFGADGLVSVAVHPGAVKTRMAEGNTPEEFLPCECLNLCCFVCCSILNSYILRVWMSRDCRN